MNLSDVYLSSGVQARYWSNASTAYSDLLLDLLPLADKAVVARVDFALM